VGFPGGREQAPRSCVPRAACPNFGGTQKERDRNLSTAVKTTKLSKIYEGTLRGRDVHALKALDLEINEGEILPTWAERIRQTTTIKIILGLLVPDFRSLEVFARNTSTFLPRQRNIDTAEGAYYPEFLRGEEVNEYNGQLLRLHGRT
jgi:ABC-type multidrug transport system ATPase subunit